MKATSTVILFQNFMQFLLCSLKAVGIWDMISERKAIVCEPRAGDKAGKRGRNTVHPITTDAAAAAVLLCINVPYCL